METMKTRPGSPRVAVVGAGSWGKNVDAIMESFFETFAPGRDS